MLLVFSFQNDRIVDKLFVRSDVVCATRLSKNLKIEPGTLPHILLKKPFDFDLIFHILRINIAPIFTDIISHLSANLRP